MGKRKNALGGSEPLTGKFNFSAEEIAHQEMVARHSINGNAEALIAKAIQGGPITKGGKGRGK